MEGYISYTSILWLSAKCYRVGAVPEVDAWPLDMNLVHGREFSGVFNYLKKPDGLSSMGALRVLVPIKPKLQSKTDNDTFIWLPFREDPKPSYHTGQPA